MQQLILASESPQREMLLKGLGFEFEVKPSSLDEGVCEEADPEKRSVILARLKAQDIAKNNPDAYVIGCDTLVVAHDGTLIEKAANEQEARKMIKKQSGTASEVHSGLCIFAPDGKKVEGISSSKVFFKKLTDADIDWWIKTELWKGRSGSFQIDGPGQFMFEKMEGDWTSVVGLPVFLLGELLAELGISFGKGQK